MNKNTVVELTGRQEPTDPLTGLLRRGAREQAIEAELSTYVKEFKSSKLVQQKACHQPGINRLWRRFHFSL